MTDQVRVERAGGVLTLTLNRPEKMNALTPEMYGVLTAQLEAADADPQTRVVLLQTSGEHFTSGNDIAEFARFSTGEASGSSAAGPFLRAITRAQTPLIAAVRGRAVGVGLTMLLHCDMVFVAEDALLSSPFVNIGVVPEAASSLLLPARIGYARAFAMFTLGEAIDGRTAADWGIANAAVPAAEVQARARQAAETLAKRPPGAVRLTKALMRDAAAYSARIEEESAHFQAQLRSAEAREALTAFLEKRPPNFEKLG